MSSSLFLLLNSDSLQDQLVKQQLSNVGPLNRSFLEAAPNEVLSCCAHLYLFIEVDGFIKDIDELFLASDAKRVCLVVDLVEDHPKRPNVHAFIVLVSDKDFRA